MKRYIRADYIFAMSMPRDIAIRELIGLSAALSEHVCKLAIYDDTLDCKKHWIHEISDFIHQANIITVKPKDRKLKLRDYENQFYGRLGDSNNDAEVILKSFYRTNKRTKQYPVVEIKSDMIRRYVEIVSTIIKFCNQYLPINNDLSFEEVESILSKDLTRIQ